ncbi:MAG TPA: hypothetical protein DIC56_03810 [Rhizobium sp.]|nr:hypothetical protein [Rhizobium sp.]
MIEYVLLFGLGFLSAALFVMLIAPAIHKRIVLYTENRLKATMPLSPQEIRAQKDMARALYAAENARASHDLIREREQSTALKLANETLAREASRLLAESQDLHVQIDEMSVEAADFRSQVRRAETEAIHLRETLKRTEEAAVAKDLEIERMIQRLSSMANEIDNLSIENATRETEIENLKMRVQALRGEREELSRETQLTTRRAKDAEIRLAQEEHKLLRLDDRLSRKMAESIDKDAIIERRLKEIATLKESLKASNRQVRAAIRALRAANLPVPDIKEIDMPDEALAEPVILMQPAPEIDTALLSEELRHRHTALTERLVKANSPASDDALREEIAEIAAKMIVLTARHEGASSPIREILSSTPVRSQEAQKSLAERAVAIDPGIPGTVAPSA